MLCVSCVHVCAQVSCERYDAKALLKKWDAVWITVAGSFLAYGSSAEKAVSRALGGASSAQGTTAMRITGCTCTALSHAGRSFVLSVSFPAAAGVPEQIFAFSTSDARDSFVRVLQAKCVAPAAPGAFASVLVASEAHSPEGGEAVLEVHQPHPTTARLASNASFLQPQHQLISSAQTLNRSSSQTPHIHFSRAPTIDSAVAVISCSSRR